MKKYQFEALTEEVQEIVINHCFDRLWEADMHPTFEYVQSRVREFLYSATGRMIDVAK